jgi:mRNA-degrading endonuclease toxin of MazEF toxin-antitoxin module
MLTSKLCWTKRDDPFRLRISSTESGLPEESTIKTDELFSLNGRDLSHPATVFVKSLASPVMKQIDEHLKRLTGL